MQISTQLKILKHFRLLAPQAITRRAVATILDEYRDSWMMPRNFGSERLITLLLENEVIRIAELRSDDYGAKTRYLLGDVSIFQLANSIYKDSFLSHGTALHLHGLAPLGSIYVNHEQSSKNTDSTLTQATLNKAFRNKQRQSNYIYRYDSHTVIFLNGKDTGCAGVVEMRGPGNELLRVTNLERTLIDAVVRPRYAGTMKVIMGVFQKAAKRVSIQRTAELLEITDYSYPYHQALGFLLSRAGVSERRLEPLKRRSSRFKFYLDYAMINPAYDPAWRIYYPADLP
jgi:predicted transcriptional regulator of viral defense system